MSNLRCLERKKKGGGGGGVLEMQKGPIKAIARWQVWVVTKVFSVVTELSGTML